jgi:hypothetical protein
MSVMTSSESERLGIGLSRRVLCVLCVLCVVNFIFRNRGAFGHSTEDYNLWKSKTEDEEFYEGEL